MSTQRHSDRNHSRGGRAAGTRALAALTVWTFVIVTGCQTQPQAAVESPAESVQPVQQPPEAVRPVSDAPQASPAVAQRISHPPVAAQGSNAELARDTQSRQWLAEKEVITPVDLSVKAPAQEQEPAAAQPLAVVTPAQAMPSLRPGMADEMVSVNFDNVEIRTVLKTIGDITGINFIPHEQVTGTVTVMSPTPIRLGDIYSYLQSILDVHGYATIETDNAVKVVPKAEAAKNHLQVRIGADPTGIPKTDVIVTQILPLKYADASDVSQIIQPLLSTGAQMATYPRTNSLMITDTSSNLHHVAQIIQQLDVAGSKERVMLFPLTHASAQVLSEQITRILEKGKSAAAQAGRSQGATATSGGPRILPDERTNSIIVIAGEQEAETVRDLIGQLDIERPVGMNNVHVTYLKNADANEVSRSLEQAMANMKLTSTADVSQQIQVTPDPSTNALVIVASPQDFEVISQIVEKLDIIREQVLVEMLIMEVTEESLKEIGVDWATMDTVVSDSIRGFGVTNLGPRVDYLAGTSEGLNVGAWKRTDSGIQIGAILHALQNESGVNILSTPSILTSNHRTAKIVVGENRPFVTDSRITESTDAEDATVIKTYEYKDVGITLEITPHVSQSGLIRLEVNSEFTKLTEDVTTLSEDTPITAKRSAQTVVTMGSGATIVIGGMIRDDTTKAVTKVPLLGDLPLVGALFQSQKDIVQKTNLLLFITPHIMSSQEDLVNMTNRKKGEMAPALEKNK